MKDDDAAARKRRAAQLKKKIAEVTAPLEPSLPNASAQRPGESDAPRKVQDDSWFFGHSFKLPYSLFRLLRRTRDQALRTAGLTRAAKLSIPFE